MWIPVRVVRSHFIFLLVAFCADVLASNKPSSSSPAVSRPPFVSHITQDDLKESLSLGTKLHNKAVQEAFANYPIDLSLPADDDILNKKIQLKHYKIDAVPGALPDFIDQLEREIFVTDESTPLLTAEECRQVIQDAEDFFSKEPGGWTQLPSGQYDVAGFWIKSIPAVHEWFCKTVRTRLFPLLAQTFPDFCESADDLCVDNSYLFKYTPETGRRTDIHTDSGCLSFTIALNSNEEYTGGGTWFEGLEIEATDGDTGKTAVIEMNTGQVTIRPGGVKHCGHAVQSGVRYIIGGFCMNRKKPEHVRQLLANDEAGGDVASRIKTLETCIALNPALDVGYNLLADKFEHDGNKAKAREVLEYCFQHVHPRSGPVAYALGSLYREAGEHQKAMNCFLTCLEADEYDIDAMQAVAGMASDMGDAAMERTYCERILATPGAAPKNVAQACCNLGVLHQGEPEEIGYYEKAIALSPDVFPPRYSMACALAERKQWKEAIDAFRSALTMKDIPDQDRIKALKYLYQASVQFIQQSSQGGGAQPVSSQEEMIQRFHQVMGEENFKALAATTRGQ